MAKMFEYRVVSLSSMVNILAMEEGRQKVDRQFLVQEVLEQIGLEGWEIFQIVSQDEVWMKRVLDA